VTSPLSLCPQNLQEAATPSPVEKLWWQVGLVENAPSGGGLSPAQVAVPVKSVGVMWEGIW
jgi:hypothetical protein